MLRLKSDLVAHCQAALNGNLDREQAEWESRPSVGIVLAAGGYPGSYAKGERINGLSTEQNPGEKVFHAGTALSDGQVVTSGGRVLCATALGETVAEAQQAAYRLADTIHFKDLYKRTDIAWRAIERENNLG